MALRIVKSNEPVFVERLNGCIYGAPGLGKTSMAFTADDPLLLDCDRGSHRAKNRKDVVQVTDWKDIEAITKDDLVAYKTLILDTAGRALDFLTADIISKDPKKGRGGALTLQGFGDLKSRFAAWLKMLNTFGKDVILICHMDEQRSGDDVIERLDVQGGSKGEIYKSVDFMGRIFVRGKERVIDFSPRENSFGKNPCGLEVLPYPDPANDGTFLGKLIAQMKTQLNQKAQEQKAAQDAIEEWRAAAADATTADEINLLISEMNGKPVAIRAIIANRAKELKLTFNKETKLYEGKQEPAPVAVGAEPQLDWTQL